MVKLSQKEKDRLERQYRFFVHPILETLKNVERVVAHIHKIEISTTLLAKDIKLSNGQKILTHPRLKKNLKNKVYTQEGNFVYFGLKCYIISYPIDKHKKNDNIDDGKNFVRASLISIVPDGYTDPQKHKNLLLKLQNDLSSGDTKVRFVELSIDIFPKKKNLVPSLFESLAKIIYVPYTVNIEDIIFDGGQLYRHKENNKKKKSRKKPNEIVERVNRVIKFKKYFKLYERSDDKNRVRVPLKRNASKKFVKAYRNKHLDRVRFEYNLVREQLRKKKINTLGDLASYTNSEGVNILHLLNEKLQFKVIDVGDRKNDYLCIMSTINEKIKNQAKKRIK